jgi:hypothetical protein
VFKFIVNPITDSYTFQLIGTIDNGEHLDFSSLSSVKSGNYSWVAVGDPSSSSGDQLLLTAKDLSTSVNVSTGSVGNGSNWIGSGGGIRLDLVTGMGNLTGTNSTGQFNFAHHYAATEMAFAITKVQSGGTAGIKVHVSNPLNDSFTGTGANSAQFLSETNVAIASIMILDINGIDVTGSRTVSFDAAHEYATIAGLHVGDQVFVTGGSSFERLEVDYSSGNQFDIGNAQVVSTVTGADIGLHVGTTLTDGDGDKQTSSSGLDVTLYSPDHNIIDHHNIATGETITGTSKNDVIITGTGHDTINLNATGGHDTVVVTTKLSGNDVISGFTDHTAANAGTEQDHINLDALFDSMGVATANRAAAVHVAQSGLDAVITVDGAPDVHITLQNHTAANINVGTDHTHDIITGSL